MEKVRYFKLKPDATGWGKDFKINTPYPQDFKIGGEFDFTIGYYATKGVYVDDWEECDEHGNTFSTPIEALRGAVQPLFVVVELLNLIKEAPDAKKALVDKAISNANEIDLDKIKELLWTV